MPVLKRTQVIDRPLAVVFATIVDVAGFPRWNPTTKSARRVTSGPTGEGTTFELQIKGFGVVPQVLRGFEQDRRVTLVPQMKFMTGGHRFVLQPEGSATRVDHELEMTPRGLFKLLTPLVAMIGKKNLRDTAAALKAHLEATGPRPPFD